MIIYKAKNKINGKCYIGQTTGTLIQRKSQHIKTAYNDIRNRNYFHWAIREWGKDNFTWKVLCNCSDKKELNSKEKY
ncbi:GIY-YIG nuclease family protein [Chlamydiota bacterium]